MPTRLGLFALIVASLPAAGLADCSPGTVSLRGDWGSAQFNVEIADSQSERSRGLMHREELPRSAGMLFLYEDAAPRSFWMRNTLIPLDIIFIGSDGVVRRVHANAVPHDETPIPSGAPVPAALEINGGLAQAYGISEGTEVRHPAFADGDPAWPCN